MLLLACSLAFGQTSITNGSRPGHQLSSAEMQQIKALHQSYRPNQVGGNRAIENIFMDYAATDDSVTVLAGDSTRGFAWSINKNWPDDSVYDFNLNYAAVLFDSLYDYPSLNTFDYADVQSMTLDSLVTFVRHTNVTGNIDTVIIKYYAYNDANPVTVDANDLINSTPLDQDSFFVNTSINPTGFSGLITRPNVSIPVGFKLAVSVDFYGDTANTFEVIATHRDACFGPSACAATSAEVPDNSFYKLIFWNGTTSITGLKPVFYNCNGNGTIDAAACELFFIQNFNFLAWVTADIQQAGGPAPVADFSGTPTTITAGQSVNFNDLSINTPTSWSWTFTGGSPGSSAMQNPTNIVYSAAGTYTVSLTATNANGTDTETKTGYITVNPASSGGGCDTLSNIYNIASDTLVVFGINGQWGTISGHNGFFDDAKADFYSNTTTGEVSSVTLFVAQADAASPSSTIDVTVWDDNGAGGTPGTVLGSQTVLISTLATNLGNGQPTVVNFTNPPVVTGDFYLGIELNYTPAGDTVALFITGERAGADTLLGSAWERWSDGTWNSYGTAWGSSIGNGGLWASHFVFPEVCPVSLSLDADFVGAPRTVFVGNSVNFTDLSAGNPTSWSWTFTGGTPGSSNAQNPANIVYPTAGTYPVSLTVGDGVGTDTETKTSYITVIQGGTSFVDCDTFANFDLATATNVGLLSLAGGADGYRSGHNIYGDASKAELFGNVNPGSPIDAVFLGFGVGKTNSPTATLNVRVWDANGTAGSPGTVLATEQVLLQDIEDDVTNGDFTVVNFSNPAVPAGNYYVGVNFAYAPGDTIALVETLTPDITQNTAWEEYGSAAGGGWFDYTTSWGDSAALWIFPIQCKTVPCPAIGATFNVTDATCTASNGSVTATGTAGAAPYSFAWGTTPAQTGPTASGLAPGQYTVTVTDVNGCTGTATATIGVTFPTISANTSTTPVTCSGSNGTATASPSAGTTPYTYVWNTTPAQSTATATGLAAGTYRVTVTDANGCTVVGTAVVGTNPGALSAITSSTPATCTASDGTVSVTASNGATPYLYSWNTTPAASTASVSGQAAGNYSVTVTDANGCSVVQTVTVGTNNGTLSGTTSSTSATCGNADGSATITATGGTAPYTYVWSGSASTGATANNLLAGSYGVTVTDVNGCTFAGNVTVVDPGSPTITQTGGNNVSCFGGSDGSITVNVTGGSAPYTYSWSVAGSGPVVNGLSAGVVGLTVSDASGCSGTFSVTITEPAAALSASITNTQNISCPGTANGSLTVTPAGGTSPFTYNWNTSPAQSSATATGLAPGTYDVTVTDDNGCTTTASGTVGQPSNPSVVNVPNAQTSGCGTATGSLTATVTGGAGPFTYAWNTSPVQNTATATGLAAGAYTVTVTDGGCTITGTGIVSDPATHSVSVTTNPVTCYNAGNGSATLITTGGSGNFSYSWPAGSGGSGAAASGLDGGLYNVTVTDNVSNCAVISQVSVFEPDSISVTINKTNVTCFGGSDGIIVANAFGGNGAPYTYTWNPGGATGSVLSNVSASTVILTVSDVSGCSNNFNVTVNQPPAITLSVTSQTNVSCNGGSNGVATVTAAGGTGNFSLVWSTTPTQTGPTASGLAAGSYTVTATDGSGCTLTQSVTITQPTALTVSASGTNVSCAGGNTGSATATASGGTGSITYTWSTSPTQTGATATNLTAGAYTVTATDVNGCTAVNSVTITQPSPISVNATETDVTCAGGGDGTASATATGGTGTITFAWSVSQSGPTATGLSAGPVTVTATDANGCTASASVNVGSGATISVTATVTDANCNGAADGAITLSGSGGAAPYTYTWSTTTGATRNNLGAGNYPYTVSDANGCSATGSATVASPSSITVTANPVAASCNGGTDGQITINVAGGAGNYSYSWTGTGITGTVTTQNLTGVPAGTYEVTVTDGNGCARTVSTLNVGEASSISVSTTVVPASSGASNGTATATATGGTGLITYAWSNGQTGASVGALAAGTYTVTATDANGCTATATADVTTTGIEGVDVLSTIELFPNPTSGLVTVKLALSTTTNVSIVWYNMLGEKVADATYENVSSVEGKFDLAEKAAGVYFAKIVAGNQSVVERVVVSK